MLFGSSKDITVGPTAIMALMIHSAVVNLNVDFAILGTFLSGCTIFLLGFLNLGFLVQFISIPTVSGFVLAATVTIGSGQVKPLLGILKGSSSEFIHSWINVFANLNEIKLYDTLLGVVTIVILMAMKNLNQMERWPLFFKYLSISRNAIAVIGGILIAYLFHIYGSEPFNLTGKITSGFPPFQLPPFQTDLNGRSYNFSEMVQALGVSLVTIPLVSILESIAIAKAFCKGSVVDATQEMICLGLCNIAGSFVSSIPITGSFTRSAINNASGVRTTFGGVITGIIVLMSLGLLTQTFYFIPKATLAAIIISAMIGMFTTEFHEVQQIFRTKKTDVIAFSATFFLSLLLGLEFGILAGISIDLLFTLYTSSRPSIAFSLEKAQDKEVMIITFDRSLIYSSSEYFKVCVMEKLLADPNINIVVIDGSAMNCTIDTTTVKVN